MPSHHPGPSKPLGGGFNNLDLRYNRRADTLDLGKLVGRGGQNAVVVAEMVHQQAGQGFHILPRDRAEQYQFKQFVIWKRCSPALHEAITQPLPMIRDVGRNLARRLGGDRCVVAVQKRQHCFVK